MFQQFGDWVAFDLLGLDHLSQLGGAVQFFAMDVVKIFVLLFIVIYLMGWLRAFVSPEKVRDLVKNKPKGVARSLAISLGAVTPFCSCSSVPLFIGFVEAGIPMGITYAFLIASPMINEVAVVILASVVGWKIALLYVLAGVVVAYIGSLIMEWFKTERWVEDYVWKLQSARSGSCNQTQGGCKSGCDSAQETPVSQATPMTLKERHDYALHEVKNIVGRIWKWVVIGIGLGALFHGYVPEAWVLQYLSDESSWWSVPAAVVLGVPLYANETGIIPIIESMLAKGVPLGTSLALMMSVVALSLPEMLILRQVIRWPALAIFASILTVSFILVGWLFNWLADYI